MKFPPPTEARCVFIDGPVGVYLHEAPFEETLAAYDRVRQLVKIAALHFNLPSPPELLNDLPPLI